MEFKELGRTGVNIPEIGLGTWNYNGGVEPLHLGISLGSFLIDTAEFYGTEPVVGEAVKGQREQVFIATKVSPEHLRYDDVLKAAENSLRRLGTNYIDLYQIHWPNPRIPIKETMRAMEKLVEMGKIRFIGVSNFSLKEFQDAQNSMTKYEIVSNQVRYNLLDRHIEDDLLPYCRENHVTVIAYSPLAKGSLTSKPFFTHRRAVDMLQKISSETGRSTAQVALNWLTSRENVIAIPKADRKEHIIENCQASGWRLTPNQIGALEKAFQ